MQISISREDRDSVVEKNKRKTVHSEEQGCVFSLAVGVCVFAQTARVTPPNPLVVSFTHCQVLAFRSSVGR